MSMKNPLTFAGIEPPTFQFAAQHLNHSHLKRIISTNFYIHTVVPPDDGSSYARNM